MHANNAGIQYKCIQTVQPASSLKQSHKVKHPRSIPKQSRKPPGTLSSQKKYMQTEAQWKCTHKVLGNETNACRECCSAVEIHADSAGTL